MTVQHSSLTGANLHGTRIPSSSANRVPNYAGEAILEGGDLVIAQGTTQDSWRRFEPVTANQSLAFSWCISLTGYTASSSVDDAALLYYQGTAEDANDFAAEGFELLTIWTTQQDFAINSVIDITPQIQRKGPGCYVFVLGGIDAYGDYRARDNLALASAIAVPSTTVELFDFTVPFIADIGSVGTPSEWVNVNGFEVLNPLSQVILTVENIP